MNYSSDMCLSVSAEVLNKNLRVKAGILTDVQADVHMQAYVFCVKRIHLIQLENNC